MQNNKSSPLSNPKGPNAAVTTGGVAGPALPPKPRSSEELTLDGASAWATGQGVSAGGSTAPAGFAPGAIIAGRYEILQALGEGGMGTVYRAIDREVDRSVALKTIRPELAANPAIIKRFKQELILARQVTHRNVVRIYDLGEADGVKFITMEFIEGRDLTSLLQEKGKFEPKEAVEIMEQVCRALEAAHMEGVVHRDLKPQNIMIDAHGKVSVMDFGIARSTEVTDAMTRTGAFIGTPQYMSPEQARGEKLGAQSDLFSFGIVFYELLTGNSPYQADTVMSALFKRTAEAARPAIELVPDISPELSGIVSKCLERDLALRYQSAGEILADLDAWRGKRPTLASLPVVVPSVRHRLVSKWVAVGGLAVAVAIAGWAVSGKLRSSKESAGPEVSLAILPFRNGSGDAGLDWLGPSLADMLNTDVGQSAHLRTISPDRLHQVLSDLRVTPGIAIDPAMVGRIAEFSNADTVVWGQYAKFGDKIRIDATLLDLKHNRRAPLKIEAASEKEIPGTVDGLAELIRKNLAVSPDVLKELKASSFQPSSKSVAALREFNQGAQLLRDGKNLEAAKFFQAAIKDDPQFALAYSRLAETDSALGYDTDAEKYSRKAVELSQQLPMAEKYLIEAGHAAVKKDNKKAIEAYENLAKTAPGNNDIQSALGRLYVETGDLEKARVHYSNVLKTEPKNLDALIWMGWLEVQKGQPQSGLDPLNRALSLAVEVDNQEQKAQVLEAMGIAYEAMNKPEEALRNFEQARDINLRLGKKAGVAHSLKWVAIVQRSVGKPDLALANYTEVLKIEREIGAKREAADTLIGMGALYGYRGQLDKALELFKESLQIQRDVGDEANQAVCLNNIGSVYENQGKNDDALTYYQQSLQLREKLGAPADIAETLGNAAEVYTKTAQYDQAMSSYMRALDIRHKASDNHGAALESDGIGVVFLYQGRFGAAVSSLQEAVKGLREAQDRSEDMVQTLNDFANALASAGRGAEATKTLEEAQGLATELKNDTKMSSILNSRGDVLLYGGNIKAAKSLYQQGLQSASRAKAPENILVSKLNLAEVAIAEGRSQSAIGDLRAIVQQADNMDLKYLSLEGSADLAEALIKSKNSSQALQELQTALSKSEKQGSRFLTLRIHYLLGNALRLSGNGAEAADHYGHARELLDDMKKEPGAEHLLDRSDLKSIYAEVTR